jgi:hypothetical protein
VVIKFYDTWLCIYLVYTKNDLHNWLQEYGISWNAYMTLTKVKIFQIFRKSPNEIKMKLKAEYEKIFESLESDLMNFQSYIFYASLCYFQDD